MLKILSPLKVFKIKREEWPVVVVSLVVFALLNYLLIDSHWADYTKGAKGGFWRLLYTNFQMSGYDCWTWLTVSYARIHFETIRHPLYLTFLYPMYQLNHWLMPITGVNGAVFIISGIITLSAVYSAVFTFRTLREIVGLERRESMLLVVLLFSFAHVMLPTMVPDHFCLSMMLLTMTMYIAGRKIQKGVSFKVWQSMLLVFFTSGIAASNGAKTMLAALFANGKRVFRPVYILVGFVLPLAVLIGIQRYQYYAFEVPQKAKIARIEKKKKVSAERQKKLSDHHQWALQHNMKTAGKGWLAYFDFETPRVPALVENYFGEGFQLHQEHALEDTFQSRPNIVRYSHWWNYAIETLLVGLIVVAVWLARKEKVMQMLLSWWALDFLLNIVLGFGINEPYIMTSGWAFSIVVAFGFMLKKLPVRGAFIAECALLFLAIYLWKWNAGIIIDYLSQHPTSVMH